MRTLRVDFQNKRDAYDAMDAMRPYCRDVFAYENFQAFADMGMDAWHDPDTGYFGWLGGVYDGTPASAYLGERMASRCGGPFTPAASLEVRADADHYHKILDLISIYGGVYYDK